MKREITFNKNKLFDSIKQGEVLYSAGIWLSSIPNGTWVLKLERKPTQRTLSQNALMWVWMDAIAEEWSEATDRYYSRDVVKEFLCRKYLPLEMPDGSVVGGSTSGLTTEQMGEFMDKVQAYAATEWGITLLNPEDKMFEQWRNQYE